uniref:Uncharacterized protein n=1 Tax=Ananas comosus var. bracteatus TaxID=296719 RepID=A0A6V7QWK9_ANACO
MCYTRHDNVHVEVLKGQLEDSLDIQVDITEIDLSIQKAGLEQRSAQEDTGVDDSLPREDAVTHLTSFVSRLLVLAVDIYSHKIKNLLEPQPEHGRIQFHRFNIKNGSQPEGVIKMTDLVPSLQLPLAPFLGDPLIPLSPDV